MKEQGKRVFPSAPCLFQCPMPHTQSLFCFQFNIPALKIGTGDWENQDIFIVPCACSSWSLLQKFFFASLRLCVR